MQEIDLAASRYEAQLKALMRLAFVLDAAGEGVLGKGAPAMMYQAGRDAGTAHDSPAGGIGDIDEALSLVLTEGEEVWHVERWRDPGQGDLMMETGGRASTWILFRRCPLLALARRVGSRPGGLLCQALHGYLAGSMEVMMGCRVDMKVGHAGPRACKILLELRH